MARKQAVLTETTQNIALESGAGGTLETGDGKHRRDRAAV